MGCHQTRGRPREIDHGLVVNVLVAIGTVERKALCVDDAQSMLAQGGQVIGVY